MLMEPFNLIHMLSFTALPLGLFLLLYVSLKNKPDKTKWRVLLIINCFNIILYFTYKIYQYFYVGYDFVFMYNLPFNFCNLNLIILLPLTLITRNKILMAFQLYVGTIVTALALVVFDSAFMSQPAFEFSCMVYFYYHSMLAVIPFAFLAFKFHTPSFKTAWQPLLIFIVLTFLVHIINVIFRSTELASASNYFYTFGMVGQFFFDWLWSMIPYPFLFMVPGILMIYLPYMIMLTLPYRLSARKKSKAHGVV